MKKVLFNAIALSALVFPLEIFGQPRNANADEKPSLIWGYCEEPDYDWAGGLPSGLKGYALIGFTENLASKFAGCTVESILIAKGKFTAEDPKIDIVFTTGTIDESAGWKALWVNEPFYEMKDVSFQGDNFSWVEIPLEEPFVIEEGKPFLAGWGYAQENDEDLPLVGDMVVNDNPETSWMGGDVIGTSMTSYSFWSNCGSAGSNCIRLRLSGDNLPTDDISIVGIDCPRFVKTGENAEVNLRVKNSASSDISEVEVLCAIPGGPQNSQTISSLSIAPGKKANIKVEGVNIPFEGNLTLEIEIIKVNGKGDADPSNNFVSGNILSLKEGNGFERNTVVEEGTGTWCGNCPRGIVGMRMMAEKYGDKFIGVAVHSGDEMEISGYAPFLARYIDVVGYPYCTLDRVISCDPNFAELEENYLEEAAVPAIAEVKILGTSIDGTQLNVNASANFCIDDYFGEYAWAYVLTEDNVGPYVQTNYFTTPGSLEGWDYTEPGVSIYFDEVAQGVYEIMGQPGSFPDDIEAGEFYENSTVIDASKIKDWNNTHLIAMVINRKTGYVENSARYSFNGSSVKVVNGGTTGLNVNNGSIMLVSGESAEVYSLSGMKIASLRNGESIKTGSGIFIVKYGDIVEKLMVK